MAGAAALALVAACTAAPELPRDAGVRDVALPNLVALVRLPLVQERTFAPGACEVMEGCTLPGRRRLLRFDLLTPNLGPADLDLGPPTEADGGARPGFAFGACHGHWHVTGFAEYRLLAGDGREVGRGHKQAFCIEDSDHYGAMGALLSQAERFDCARQGLHAGWMDIYGRNLDCQYVDVTDVAPGRYTLRATVNFEGRIAESRTDDNRAELSVELTPWDRDASAPVDAADDAPAVDPARPCASGEQGEHRDCGWDVEASARRCVPGARVALGCDPACAPPLGECAGDPVLRVCEGERPCADGAALAAGNDSCEVDGGRNPCARVGFTCPASGLYRVLTGPYRAGAAYACRPSAL